jgi:uncharacterized iron-regulated protein
VNLIRFVTFLTVTIFLSAWLSSGFFAAPLTRPAVWSSKSQTWITYEDLVKHLQRADLIFLGELHDNPQHHEHRARLLEDLNRRNLHVVFEQLPSQAPFLIPREGGSLLAYLQSKGFNEKAWQWPLHEPLFLAAQRIGLSVTGGNLIPGQGRRFFSDGLNAVSGDIKSVLDNVPLSAVALEELDVALIEGHCGHLPESMLPTMRLVQQSTDISMALSAVASLPAVVIAGNGHVQKNFGMPHYASYLRPTSNVASVGFLESALLGVSNNSPQEVALTATEPPPLRDQQLFDFIWMTTRIDREDPCKALINFNQR